MLKKLADHEKNELKFALNSNSVNANMTNAINNSSLAQSEYLKIRNNYRRLSTNLQLDLSRVSTLNQESGSTQDAFPLVAEKSAQQEQEVLLPLINVEDEVLDSDPSETIETTSSSSISLSGLLKISAGKSSSCDEVAKEAERVKKTLFSPETPREKKFELVHQLGITLEQLDKTPSNLALVTVADEKEFNYDTLLANNNLTYLDILQKNQSMLNKTLHECLSMQKPIIHSHSAAQIQIHRYTIKRLTLRAEWNKHHRAIAQLLTSNFKQYHASYDENKLQDIKSRFGKVLFERLSTLNEEGYSEHNYKIHLFPQEIIQDFVDTEQYAHHLQQMSCLNEQYKHINEQEKRYANRQEEHLNSYVTISMIATRLFSVFNENKHFKRSLAKVQNTFLTAFHKVWSSYSEDVKKVLGSQTKVKNSKEVKLFFEKECFEYFYMEVNTAISRYTSLSRLIEEALHNWLDWQYKKLCMIEKADLLVLYEMSKSIAKSEQVSFDKAWANLLAINYTFGLNLNQENSFIYTTNSEFCNLLTRSETSLLQAPYFDQLKKICCKLTVLTGLIQDEKSQLREMIKSATQSYNDSTHPVESSSLVNKISASLSVVEKRQSVSLASTSLPALNTIFGTEPLDQFSERFFQILAYHKIDEAKINKYLSTNETVSIHTISLAPSNSGIPSIYLDFLTHEIMTNPAVIYTGYAYDRVFIEQSLEIDNVNDKKVQMCFVPHLLLRNEIHNYLKLQPRYDQEVFYKACQEGDIAVIDKQLCLGAELHCKDKQCYTPLHYAVKYNRNTATQLLLAAGANLAFTTDKGWIPLHIAANYGHVKILNTLLPYTATPYLKDLSGNTPLHLAAKKGHFSVVTLLVSKGASIHTSNAKGHTPLVAALKGNHNEVIRFLIEQGADLSALDKQHRTLLHMLAKKDYSEYSHAIRLLMQAKLNPFICDQDGYLPYQVAIKNYQFATAAALQAYMALYNPDMTIIEEPPCTKKIKFLDVDSDEDNQFHFQLELRERLLQLTEEKLDIITMAVTSIRNLLQGLDLSLAKAVCSFITKVKQPQELMPSAHKLSQKKLSLNISTTKTFKRINALLDISAQLKLLLKNEKKHEAIRKYLEDIEQSYNQYKNVMSSSTLKDYSNLLEPKVTITGIGLDYRYLKKDYLSYLFMSAIKSDRSTSYGMHQVNAINGIHFKADPHAPGIEFAVYSLWNAVAKRGTPETSLLKVWRTDTSQVVLASRTIEGINLYELLLNKPAWICKIDRNNFSLNFILSLLVNPADGKAENYIAKIKKDSKEEVEAVYLEGIDNDMGFSYPIVSLEDKTHALGVKDILYCLPQMATIISEGVRNLVLDKIPEHAIIEWLKQIIYKANDYSQLYEQNILTAKELEKLHLPIKFVEGQAMRIYRTLKQIQKWLKKEHTLTHWQLLNKIEPVLHACYQKASNKSSSPLHTYRAINRMPALEDYLGLDYIVSSGKTLKEHLSISYPDIWDFEDKRTQLPLAMLEDFISKMNFFRLSQAKQNQVFDVIFSIKDISHLSINQSLALTDNHLEKIALLFNKLESISLLGCRNITIKGLDAIISAHPKTSITIDKEAFSDKKSWHELIKNCACLAVVLNEQNTSIVIDIQDAFILHKLLSEGPPILIECLLERGASLEEADLNGLTPLHIAAKHGLNSIIQVIMPRVSNTELETKAGDTLLDIALLNGHMNTAQLLIELGVKRSNRYTKQYIHLLHETNFRKYPFFMPVAKKYNPKALSSIWAIQKAITFLKKTLSKTKRLHDEKHPKLITILSQLGDASLIIGEPSKSIYYFEQALILAKETYKSEEHPQIKVLIDNLAHVTAKEKIDKQETALARVL